MAYLYLLRYSQSLWLHVFDDVGQWLRFEGKIHRTGRDAALHSQLISSISNKEGFLIL